mmetsp:Transcript_10505/g.24276  ORF Transcript_10505/g.24276 Transcript_10505/m.24276 type:complete len:250 (-) Transcript_10505:65-814(-)
MVELGVCSSGAHPERRHLELAARQEGRKRRVKQTEVLGFDHQVSRKVAERGALGTTRELVVLLQLVERGPEIELRVGGQASLCVVGKLLGARLGLVREALAKLLDRPASRENAEVAQVLKLHDHRRGSLAKDLVELLARNGLVQVRNIQLVRELLKKLVVDLLEVPQPAVVALEDGLDRWADIRRRFVLRCVREDEVAKRFYLSGEVPNRHFLVARTQSVHDLDGFHLEFRVEFFQLALRLRVEHHVAR